MIVCLKIMFEEVIFIVGEFMVLNVIRVFFLVSSESI